MTGAATESAVRGALPRPGPDAVEIRCPAIETARSIREDYGAFCHLSEQDRRFRTVWLEADTPQFIVDRVRERVHQDRDTDPRVGQSTLTRSERNRLQQRDGWNFGTKGFHAQACKAIAEYFEVRDWTAHYDHELTVDEHWHVFESVTGQRQTLREMQTDTWGGD